MSNLELEIDTPEVISLSELSASVNVTSREQRGVARRVWNGTPCVLQRKTQVTHLGNAFIVKGVVMVG